ncbi:MAG: SDR family oxidoreductase [Deltaproteobacteria bacterium]|nr:MAG: SDR family oxidoreductase [Deltaproteobacteria bacterium]
MSSTVLVLASTGTTGTATVRHLLAAGATVRGATRDPSRAPKDTVPTLFDWDDRGTWGPALDGVDAVYLVNPAYRPDEVALATALVDAAKAAGVRKIVKLSAMGVEHFPESTHRQVELYIENSGLQWVHLRPTFFMENFATFYGGPIKAEGAIYLPAGDGKTPFIASTDIGASAAKALLGDDSGEAWTLTGPELLDHAEVAEKLTDALGKPVRYIDVPEQGWASSLQEAGMPPLAIDVLVGLYQGVRAHAFEQVTDTVPAVLGRSPVGFDQWSRDHKDAWQ